MPRFLKPSCPARLTWINTNRTAWSKLDHIPEETCHAERILVATDGSTLSKAVASGIGLARRSVGRNWWP